MHDQWLALARKESLRRRILFHVGTNTIHTWKLCDFILEDVQILGELIRDGLIQEPWYKARRIRLTWKARDLLDEWQHPKAEESEIA